MDKNNISIATITWARDAQEDKLLRESLCCLSKQNIPVIVADGGSGKAFVDYLKGFSDFIVLESQKPNLLTQVKLCLSSAKNLGKQFVLYTESDKLLFFMDGLSQFIAKIPDSQKIGVALASRSTESFSTFPKVQKYTESVINQLCEEILGQSGDFCYGPQLLNIAILPYLNLIEADIGWGWRFFNLGIAHQLGYEIIEVIVDTPCPLQQREESNSEKIYRMNQLAQNIRGLLLSVEVSVMS